ncbi:MAG: hypothetical protein Tsb0013_11740 [Phycisphaerales bacterium]
MRTVSLVCTLSLCAGAAAQDLTIADIAPENTFLVVGVDDASTALASFKKTGGWKLLNDPEIAEWLEDQFAEPMEQLEGFLETIDASTDDLAEPTGMMGLAAWLNPPMEGAEGNDALPYHFIMGAGFGDEATNMHDMIVRAIEEGENEDTLTYERDRLGDAEIYTVRPIVPEVEDDWDDDFGDDDEWGDDDWGGDFDAAPTAPEEFFYARHGEMLLLSTSMTSVENALSRIDGVDFDNAAGTASFSRLKPAGEYDAYVLLLNGPLYDMADTVFDEEQAAMMGIPPVMNILDALGLSEVRGVSITMDFDHPKGDTVGEFFVSAPRLRGLMGLINVPDKPFSVPSFVTADAANVSLFQFDIAGLLPALNQALNNMPPEIAGQGQFFLQMAMGQIGPVLDQLGPEIYVTQTYRRPFSTTSQENLIAIASKNDDQLNGVLAALAPQMGLEGRDFQGNQIWSAGAGFGGGMMPMPEGGFSLGVGFGHMFMGPDSAVEGAMRQAAEGDSGFADNASFKRAMGTISNNGLAFAYQNLEETLAYQSWMFENMDEIMAEQMQGMGGMGMPVGPNPLENLPDLGKMAQYFGDSIMEYQLVDGGIKGTYVFLRPAE